MRSTSADYHRAFKDADIRGVYPTEIDEEVAYFIARAFIDQFSYKKIVVGCDMRLSTPALHAAFVRGVIDAGADVLDIGMVHTPLLYFASGSLQLPGVMITASHSPKEYNGLKLVHADAVPLTEKNGLGSLRKRIDKGVFDEPKKNGVVKVKDLRAQYQKFILRGIKSKRYAGLNIVADVGNGMASVLLPLLQQKLPIDFTTLFLEPDGRFPNRESDPTLKKNQKVLQKTLKEGDFDFGIGFDGDSDRIAFLDEKGSYINSALIGALIAKRLLQEHKGAKIVYTNLTSRMFEETIKAAGGKPVIARVGHAFIKETMRKKDVLFGCEHSGHFYYQKYFYTDSVALTLFYVLDEYVEAKKAGLSFSHMMAPFMRYRQNEDVIVDVDNREQAYKKTVAYMESLAPKKVKFFDGIMVDFGTVWGSVKISVTEYALKIMFESEHKLLAEAMQKQIVAYVKSIAKD